MRKKVIFLIFYIFVLFFIFTFCFFFLFLDLAIERVFDEDTGLVKFLTLSIKKNKQFKSQNIKVLQLIAQLIQTFKQKIIPYAVQIQKVGLILFNKRTNKQEEVFTVNNNNKKRILIYCYLFFFYSSTYRHVSFI